MGFETTSSHSENFLRSFTHISIWSSPDPARVISPVSSFSTFSSGSDFDSFVNPLVSLGRSAGLLGLTATLKTGATEYFIDRSGWDTGRSTVEMVPVFCRHSSIPVRATVFPQGGSWLACLHRSLRPEDCLPLHASW